MNEGLVFKYNKIMNQLAKWRVLFAGWQLGTRPKGDPECDAVSDSRELLLLMRVELNAIVRILQEKKIVTVDETHRILIEEIEYYMKHLEQRFPGVKSTDMGLTLDMPTIVKAGWMRNWRH